MTNYEMIKNQSIYLMALSLMCPYKMGFWDDYRCKGDKRNMNCGKCTLEWLQEEAQS